MSYSEPRLLQWRHAVDEGMGAITCPPQCNHFRRNCTPQVYPAQTSGRKRKGHLAIFEVCGHRQRCAEYFG
eukprot:5655423-Amphidinium_carterae.1